MSLILAIELESDVQLKTGLDSRQLIVLSKAAATP